MLWYPKAGSPGFEVLLVLENERASRRAKGSHEYDGEQ